MVFNNLQEIAEYIVRAGEWKTLPDSFQQLQN